MKILFLVPNIPPTPRAPGSPRLYDLMRGLKARGHTLALVCGVDDMARWQEFLERDGGTQLLERVYPVFGGPRLGMTGRVWNLFSLRPAFHTGYRAPTYYAQMRQTVAHAIHEFECNVLHVDQLLMAQYVPQRHACVYVIDPHDAISLAEARKLTLNRMNVPRRILQRYQTAKIRRYEGTVAARADAYIVNSQPDGRYLQAFIPRSKLHVIPNCVDTDFFHPAPEVPIRAQLVFTAAYSYLFNVDAMLHFCGNILPRLRPRFPNLRLMIVGAQPPRELQELTRDPLISVTGYVEDVRPYIWESAVVISPIRSGTGVKNKLLNAMALGKAIVATASSAEGLGVRNGEHMLVAQSDEAFAEAVARVLNDSVLAQELGVAGRAFVVNEYGCQNLALRFEKLYTALAQK